MKQPPPTEPGLYIFSHNGIEYPVTVSHDQSGELKIIRAYGNEPALFDHWKKLN